jgi:NAD(P)-dependent dehydrogenase (short-subunit alcohol dehydrogenase family)
MTFGLEGRHVVITGGAGALGQAVVRSFVDAGAVCHLPVRAAAETSADPAVNVVTGIDLADEQAVAKFFAARPPLWASVHLAGGFRAGPIVETSRADLERQLDTNLVTAFLCCREAVRSLRASGGGRIVNVGSRASEAPSGGAVAYAASKAAVAALTRSLAEEVRADHIQVNAVLPSVIDTPANRAAMPAADFDTWLQPAKLARVILWLASPENALVTGALVPVGK